LILNVQRFLKTPNKITGNSISSCEFLSSLFLLGVVNAVTCPGRQKKKRRTAVPLIQLLDTGKTVNRCTKNNLKMERNLVF